MPISSTLLIFWQMIGNCFFEPVEALTQESEKFQPLFLIFLQKGGVGSKTT